MEGLLKMPSPSGLGIEQKIAASIVHEEYTSSRQEDKLKSAKAEMGEVREENERLKMMLERVEKDYQSLQLRFFDILKGEVVSKKCVDDSAPSHDNTEEPELVSLCLGRSPRESKKDEKTTNSCKTKENDDLDACLTLGLDSKFQLSKELVPDLSPANSLEESKEGETCGRNKSQKTLRNGDEESSQQTPAKRARVSVRARCDTPTMGDGCHWRKYGQKISKGNPCPRAYYRCTVATACPVRKQVQRCAEDMSILITTYEGSHNHPLPVSATAMASTTSAAASMLLSGSSTSQPGHGGGATLLNGLNFSLLDHSGTKQIYLPNSPSPLFPTITLDLTSTASSSSTHFNRLSSNFAPSPRFSSTSPSFCSSEPNILPAVWRNGYLNNGTIPYNKTHMGSINMGNQLQEHFYQPFLEKNQASSREALAETLTKAITSDPSLRSVIAAAVSSVVGTGATLRNQNVGETSSFNMKLEEHLQAVSSNPVAQNGKGCSSSYFNRLLSSGPQAGNLMLLQPTLPFSISKSSATPSVIGDHINN